MARVLVLVLCCGAGCAQLVGIDDTTGKKRDGNEITMTRTSIGKTVESGPLDLTGLQATYLAPGTDAGSFKRVLADDAGDGKWTADLPEAAAVVLTVPGEPMPLPALFAFPSRTLKVPYDVLEHPNRSPAPATAMVKLMVTLEAPTAPTDPTEVFQIYTVGSWTRRKISQTELPAEPSTQIALTYPFSSSANLSGRAQLDRLTSQDVYLILRYASGALTGVAEAMPFDQPDNEPATPVFPTMTAVVPDQMLDVKLLDPLELAARYARPQPAVVPGSLSMSWSLTAAPGARLAQTEGPPLHGGPLLQNATSVAAKYANPFVASHGWTTVFKLSTSETRKFTPAGTATEVTLSAGMDQIIEPSAGVMLTLPAALPERISIGETPLTADGQTIPMPTKFFDVTVMVGSPIPDAPTPTIYMLQVNELLPNAAATVLTSHLLRTAMSDKSTFTLPPETFQAGHRYTIRALCQVGGYPGIATGDLANRTLPVAQSYLDSAVFTVTQ